MIDAHHAKVCDPPYHRLDCQGECVAPRCDVGDCDEILMLDEIAEGRCAYHAWPDDCIGCGEPRTWDEAKAFGAGCEKCGPKHKA